ncbi:MAG TPA: HAD-IIIC family phosphatase [Verrucomicrobiae bacterium]|nr:HAD-IIIC family phosphatase [Verrucomicrobiae bacterium]
MNPKAIQVELISDFNLQTLGNYLENNEALPAVAARVAPFGRVVPWLLNQDAGDRSSFAVVWASPTGVIPAFADAVQGQAVHENDTLEQVRQFARHIVSAKTRFRSVLVCAWTLPGWQRGLGLLDLQNPAGLRNLLLKMNLELIAALQNQPGIFILDAHEWIESAGKNAYSPKLWYLSKTPYGGDVLKQAALGIKSALQAILGETRKLIVTDLDDTLWGGVVGDIGWENLRLGGHDHVGEAYIDLQRALKMLRNRGILLAIASKNDESVALEALRKHPEMVLRPEDFAAWRINWRDKAASIAEIAAELRLGPQSIVFLDDNPVERARVREAFPEVLVPDWPSDKTLGAMTLLQMTCFDSAQSTSEDRSRAEMYAAEQKREDLKAEVPGVDDWLRSLETKVVVEELNRSNQSRVAQLFNKTNQMNLATRRMSESEIAAWAGRDGRHLFAFRVSDRFGDSGLTGILTLDFEGDSLRIVDFILSCRVMGRQVEEAMLAVASEFCRQHKGQRLLARYIPTAKNKPCHEFWMRSGFEPNSSREVFTWNLNRKYPTPSAVEIRFAPKGLEDDPADSPIEAAPLSAS